MTIHLDISAYMELLQEAATNVCLIILLQRTVMYMYIFQQNEKRIMSFDPTSCWKCEATYQSEGTQKWVNIIYASTLWHMTIHFRL